MSLISLNAAANIVLRLIGLGNAGGHQKHSEDELRILLSQSQTEGIMSFRRLLFVRMYLIWGVKGTRCDAAAVSSPKPKVECALAREHGSAQAVSFQSISADRKRFC